MTLKGRVTRGLKWQVVKIGGKQLLSVVVFTTLARLLDPSDFGLVALVSVYSYFASMLADFGIGSALVQRKDLEKAHIDAAFWFNGVCSAVLCLGTILLAGPIGHLMGEPNLAPLLRWSSLGLLFGAASSVQTKLFVKAMDFRRPTVRTLVANAVGGAVGVGMALTGYGVWALVGQMLVGNLAGSIVICAASTYRPSFSFSMKHLRDLMGVGSSIFANALIWFFSSRLDQLVIGRFAGVPALGLYVISAKLPEMAKTAIQQPITDVAVPALAGLQHNHQKMRHAIYRGMELNALVMFAVFVGIAAIATDLVPFLFGAKWMSAASLCSLLCLYALGNALQIFFYPALLASGVTGKYILLNLGHAAGVFVACVVGIRFGVQYLVVGLIINSQVLVVPGLFLLRKRIGLSPAQYYRPCIFPAIGAALMWLVIWTTTLILPASLAPAAKLAIQIIVGGTTYLAFQYYLNRPALLNLIDTVLQTIGLRSKPLVSTPLAVP